MEMRFSSGYGTTLGYFLLLVALLATKEKYIEEEEEEEDRNENYVPSGDLNTKPPTLLLLLM